LITQHLGSRIVFLRQRDFVGREFLEQPDQEYAALIARAYAEVLHGCTAAMTILACLALFN
jgi:hypothetical protein